ncbi:MAG: hypothetical protein EOM73_14585 [Bacteroidia bacterium]|nr:hypothetical protein [Bacteroidia bacterium]
MKNLFYMGGPLFMGILTVILIIMVAWAVYHFLPVITKRDINFAQTKAKLKHIKTIGSFALVTGVLGQLIGLYAAFEAIEQVESVAQPVLMGGLKVSMIPTIYGIVIFLISLLLWFVSDYFLSKKAD